MLSSTFTKFAKVDINSGKAGGGTSAQKPGILISLNKDIWRVNGQSVEAEGALSTIKSLVETAPQTAILLVRNDTTSQQMIFAIEQLRKISGLTLSVAQ